MMVKDTDTTPAATPQADLEAQTEAQAGAASPEAPEEARIAPGSVTLLVPGAPADGPISFVRPGVETRHATVKGGKITASRENADWLIQNGAAYEVAAE
jgi:hypothetical protein